mgnify:CR=1 FL=1
MTSNALLYTEMVTTGALIHGDRERFLRYHEAEHPLALQLGGSDPAALAQCARLTEEWGYDEVNLNVGCPSDRVQNNMIGACLMAHPALVADCIKAMQDATAIDVTIKHRIGIDDMDSYEQLRRAGVTIAPAVTTADGATVTFADGAQISPGSVILATGYDPGDHWLPETARTERPRRTTTGLPGLFVAGMPHYGGRGSDTIAGVSRDATTIAQHIINRP